MDSAHQRIHHCVGLLLCSGDRVLLARRSSTKSWYPDCWDVIGGHIEPGETHIEALLREASEELAIDLDPDETVLLSTVRADDLELAVFVANNWSGTLVNAAPDEHDKIAWLTPDEIAQLTLAHPAIYDLATQALRVPPGPELQ